MEASSSISILKRTIPVTLVLIQNSFKEGLMSYWIPPVEYRFNNSQVDTHLKMMGKDLFSILTETEEIRQQMEQEQLVQPIHQHARHPKEHSWCIHRSLVPSHHKALSFTSLWFRTSLLSPHSCLNLSFRKGQSLLSRTQRQMTQQLFRTNWTSWIQLRTRNSSRTWKAFRVGTLAQRNPLPRRSRRTNAHQMPLTMEMLHSHSSQISATS